MAPGTPQLAGDDDAAGKAFVLGPKFDDVCLCIGLDFTRMLMHFRAYNCHNPSYNYTHKYANSLNSKF